MKRCNSLLKIFLFRILPIYCGIIIGLFLFQRHLLYYPSSVSLSNPSQFKVKLKIIHLQTQDGLDLVAWYVPNKKLRPTLLYFHGNAGSIEDRVQKVMPFIQAGWGVLLVEYRGYAGNPGKISEAGFYKDADSAWQFLMLQHVQASCIVLYGESLGSGVAVETALHHKPGAIILESAFTSIPGIAQFHYFYIPAYWLVQDRYDSLSKINRISTPILFIHGSQDSIVPIKYAKKLYQAAIPPKKFIEIHGAEHKLSVTPEMIQWVNSQLVKCRPKQN